MKRIGRGEDLIAQITEYANIVSSIDTVLKGRKRKRSRAGRRILAKREEVIARLQREIREGSFRITGYREMEVTEGGKRRNIQSVSMYERIGCNAIMSVVEKYMNRRFIRTTSASIKNRGMHDLKNYIQRDIANDPQGTRYCYKADVRKFYESIDQDVMLECLRRVFKDERLMVFFERFVRMMSHGLSIGLRSSQGFGNLLLSVVLDHYLKDQLGVGYYYRYCDDIVILAADKATLWGLRDKIHSRLAGAKLEIKPNERVFPTSEGIDFLGFVIISGTYSRLRKRNKKNAARRLHKLKSKRRRREIIASLYGQAKHANCAHFFHKLTNHKMAEMKRLSETGIKAKYSDGKKRFEGADVNISELVGEEFVIVDFETDVVTRPQKRDYEERVEKQRRELENYTNHGMSPPQGFVYPDQVEKPVGKYVVSIKRNVGQPNEIIQKLFTGDGENKSLLDQMREQSLLGQVLCSVKSVRCKGFNRYVFV